MTSTQAAIASDRSVFIIGAAVTGAAVVLYLFIALRARSSWTALALASAIVVSFWHWSAGGSLGPQSNPIASAIISVLIVLAAMKYANRHYLKILAFVLPVAYTVTLGLLAAVNSLSAPNRIAGVQTPAEIESLVETPDIVLIVLDGYGRADVMRDLYDYDNEAFLEHLRAQGFEVAENAVSNYSITHMSLPALLNMSYMHPDGAAIGNNDLDYLADQIAGENDLIALLEKSGYVYVHGEGDHWHNQCGELVDVCLPGPSPDVTGYALLQRTPIGGLFHRETSSPATSLNVTRIHQLNNWSETTRDWSAGPRFVFLHLPLPHPPLFLDSNCNTRFDPVFDVHVLTVEKTTEDELQRRRQAWIEQVECANRTIRAFLEDIDSDAVIVIVSDHGPDSYYSLGSEPSVEGLRERFGVLTAVRSTNGCDNTIPDDIDTVNLFRDIMSCLAREDIPRLESRHFEAGFAGPIVNVEPVGQTATD